AITDSLATGVASEAFFVQKERREKIKMARRTAVTEVAPRNETQTDKALSGPKDLRGYLQKLIEYDSRQLMIVDKEIDPIFEATAIVDQMRNDARYPNYPAVLFRRIKGSSIPLLINLQ